MKKTFEKWIADEVDMEFGLQQVPQLAFLDEWLAKKPWADLKDSARTLLSEWQVMLNDNFEFWNEEELKMQFIAPVLQLVNFNNYPLYKPFAERPLRFKKDTLELMGTVDWMLASGKQVPRKPYYFLHEYKKETGTTADPRGQLLIELVTAQMLNNGEKNPIYGTYITGKDWYFVVLSGQEYAISHPFHANEEPDLMLIFATLVRLKTILNKMIMG